MKVPVAAHEDEALRRNGGKLSFLLMAMAMDPSIQEKNS